MSEYATTVRQFVPLRGTTQSDSRFLILREVELLRTLVRGMAARATPLVLLLSILITKPCAGYLAAVPGRAQEPNTSSPAQARARTAPYMSGTTANDESSSSQTRPAETSKPTLLNENGGSTPIRHHSGWRRHWSKLAVHQQVHRLFGSFQPLISRVIALAGVSDEDVRSTLSRTLAWICYGALALTAVGTLGVDIKPLLGLSTLFGFALSISAKSILSNTFSAAYVMWVRPFKRGDYITVCEFGKSDKYTGKVLSVDYHYVRLLSSEGNIIMVPSHAVYGKVVELPKGAAGV